MTSLKSFNSASIVQSNGMNGVSSNYTFTIDVNIPLLASDILLITIPQDIKLVNPICYGIIGFTASLSCSLNQDKLRITVSLNSG